MSTQKPLTLVIGGTGTTGSRVVKRLQEADLPVRVGSRSGTPPFSWDDQSTWENALRGVDRAYIVHPVLATLEAAEQIGALAHVAKQAGVQRLVLLSAHGSGGISIGAEESLIEAGTEWTIVRPSWFNQNFDGDFMMGFRDAIRSGELAQPLGNGKFGFVDAQDIADVVFASLTSDNHIGQKYELTGPRLLSFADAIREISTAIGREVRYTALTAAEYRDALISQGVSPEEAEMMSMEMPDVDEELGDGVQKALGREPIDFSTFAKQAASAGAWDN